MSTAECTTTGVGLRQHGCIQRIFVPSPACGSSHHRNHPGIKRLENLSVVGELARHAGDSPDALLSFDVNYRPALWDPDHAAPVLLDLARRADVVFVGCDEADQLWGLPSPTAIRALCPDVPQLVVKDSSSAAYCFSNAAAVAVPALRTTVVEPVERGTRSPRASSRDCFAERTRVPRCGMATCFTSAALSTVADQVVPPTAAALAAAASVDDETWSADRPANRNARMVGHIPRPAGNTAISIP